MDHLSIQEDIRSREYDDRLHQIRKEILNAAKYQEEMGEALQTLFLLPCIHYTPDREYDKFPLLTSTPIKGYDSVDVFVSSRLLPEAMIDRQCLLLVENAFQADL